MRTGKRTAAVAIQAFLAMMIAGSAATAAEKAQDRAVMLTPREVEWKPNPASLPPGAKVAVLEGDPKQQGTVTMRLAFPPDYQLMPHTHEGIERVTVISGTLYFGLGEKMDPAQAKPLPAGSFFAFPPDTPMFGFTRDQATVIQLNVQGPWGVTYLEPADDPRKKR